MEKKGRKEGRVGEMIRERAYLSFDDLTLALVELLNPPRQGCLRILRAFWGTDGEKGREERRVSEMIRERFTCHLATQLWHWRNSWICARCAFSF